MAGENSVLAAINAVPEEYADTIVKISASNCNPDPSEWIILAYQDEIGDGPREFKIVDGQVDQNHATFKIGQLVAHSTAIDRSRVNFDSTEVFELAQQTFQGAGKNIVSVNLALTQDGDGAAPTWTVTGIGDSGAILGSMRISADSGAVFSREIKPGTP